MYDEKIGWCWYNVKALELSLFYIFQNIQFKHEMEMNGILPCLSNQKHDQQTNHTIFFTWFSI